MLVRDGNKTEYIAELGDKVSLRCGGKDIEQFCPHIEASKWDGEVWMRLRLVSPNIETNLLREHAFIDGQTILRADNVTWKSYIHKSKEHVLETEVIFDSKPSSNKLLFEVDQPEGLGWHYQGELPDDEEDLKIGLENIYRPDNVAGGFSLYWNPNYWSDKHLGIQSKFAKRNGKFCQMYAWQAVDAVGNRIKIPLQYAHDLLTLEIDQSFLDRAVYPVIVMGMGDTVGFSGATDTTITQYAERIFVCSHATVFKAASSGNIDSAAVDVEAAGSNKCIIVCYLDNAGVPDSLHSYGYEITEPATRAYTTDSSYPASGTTTITLNTLYWIGMFQTNLGTGTQGYDYISGYLGYYATFTGQYPTPPASFGAGSTYNSRAFGAYITYTPGVELTVQELAHAHALDGLSLTQVHTLAMQELAHAHTLDSPALTQVHALILQELAHAHALDAPVLTQVHNLLVGDLLHNHGLDPIILTQVHTLAVQELGHSHTIDNVILEAGAILIIQALLHSHALDGISLTQAHTLATQDMSHAHSLDAVELITAILLIVNNLAHGHALDNTVLTQVHQLVINELAHLHGIDPILLTQAHTITVQDIAHSHGLDSVELVTAVLLILQDLLHDHALDAPILTQVHNLIIQELAHLHGIDPIALTQAHQLIVQELAHSHALDNVTFAALIGIIDTVIASITASREIDVKTVQRIFHSITPERSIGNA